MQATATSPVPKYRADMINTLDDFIAASHAGYSPCPEGYFKMVVNETGAPRRYLLWSLAGYRMPQRCAECHVPQYERIKGGTHTCYVEKCTSWRDCLGKHEKYHKMEIMNEREAVAVARAQEADRRAQEIAERTKTHGKCTLQNVVANNNLNGIISAGRGSVEEEERLEVLSTVRKLQQKRAPPKQLKLVKKSMGRRKKTEGSIMGTKIKQQAESNQASRFCSFLWGSQASLSDEDNAIKEQIRKELAEGSSDDDTTTIELPSDEEEKENCVPNQQLKRRRTEESDSLDLAALDVHTLQQMMWDNSHQMTLLQQQNEKIKKLIEEKMAALDEQEIQDQKKALLEQLAILERVQKTERVPRLL